MIRRPQAAGLTVATMLAGLVAVAPGATAGPAPGPPSRSTKSLSAQAAGVTSGATHKVIVLLKDQPKVVSARSAAFTTRRSRIIASQAPIVKELKAASPQVRSYQLVNALAATVSTAEQAKLEANPAVASIIPDEVIKAPAPSNPAAAAGPTRVAPSGACPSGSRPLLEPEALGVTKTQSDNPKDKTARSLGYTGAGVKVAYMAEGIDVNNPDFIRADGSHVFVDYQDFSSDGTDAPTDGAEAFLDASAIAAQGRQTYDIQNFAAVPLTKPCTIRIEGVSPGASLVGLKVFADNNASLTSGFLQAIDYAVQTKVDVLNQSFGANPFPDNATADAIALFDKAAAQAGVTVTVSSGDAGPTNTIGSPSSAPGVISVGGSTTYRFYAQTGYGGYYPLAKGGWLNDNISPLSSSGFTQSGETVDLLAPGDLDFALCTADATLYTGCTNFTGTPSPVEESGGTSESAPLTAGAAALVIEAYRHAHHGSSPSPATVKQLLTTTADDLGHPAQEQGSGRLNTYQAVLAALSVHDSKGSPTRTGSTLLTSKTQIDATALPGTKISSKLTLTNNGATSQKLSLSQKTLGPVLETKTGSVTLSDSASSHFTDYAGQQTNYQVAHFTVRPGRARLDVDYVYPGDPSAGLSARVRLALIDPKGRFAAHSLPQGVGNAGHVDVRSPAAGTWTAMIWSRGSAVHGTTGKVSYQATTHNYRSSGSVSSSSITLAAGASRTVTVTATTPAKPGDQANSVRIVSSTGQSTSVPVALRSLINIKTGGTYSGVLTGGNGRSSVTGQTGYYKFSVPKGQRDLTANFTLSGHATDPAYGYLVDPAGNAQATSSVYHVTGFDQNGNALVDATSTMSLFVRAPAAGQWTLILNFTPVVTGTVLSRAYSGQVRLNTVSVSAGKLPNSSKTVLKAGTAVTVPVKIKNTGVAPESFFLDPRLNKTVDLTMAQLAPSPFTLPLTPSSYEPQWNVPTETTKVKVGVSATVPVNFDFGWMFGFGDPDIAGTSSGTTATGSYSGHPVPSGAWFAAPAEIGPFGKAGAPAATAEATLTATTLAFDPAVTTTIGNFEAGAVDPTTPFEIVTVQPGHSLTIPVTITPSGPKGTVVSGQLFVDDLSILTTIGAVPSGEELAGLPYQYTIG